MVNALQRLDGPGASWIHVHEPPEEFLESMAREYGFRHDDLAVARPQRERPRLSLRPGYAFLVLHFPVRREQGSQVMSVEPAELDIFLTPDVIITSVTGKLPSLDLLRERLTRDGVERSRLLQDASRITSEILETCLVATFPTLRAIHEELHQIEDHVFHGHATTLARLLALRQELITMRHVVMEARAVTSRLGEVYRKFFGGSDDQVSHLLRHVEDIWTSLESARETVESFWQAQTALVTKATNEAIKTLTMIAVVTFPLTLVAAIFTMRVGGVPFAESVNGFWEVVGAMVGIAVAMLAYFKHKKWL